MMKIPMFVFCIAAFAGCAGARNETKLDRRVTRIDDVKPGTATRTADAPSEPQAPDAPRIDVTLPSQDWLMKRDVILDPKIPPAPVMLINLKPRATVFFILFPSEMGSPKAMAEMQRQVLVKQGVTCGNVSVSKDGKQAGFTTEMKTDDGLRKGKTSFILRDNRKDQTVVLFGSWDAPFDKEMSSDYDKAAASVTLK